MPSGSEMADCATMMCRAASVPDIQNLTVLPVSRSTWTTGLYLYNMNMTHKKNVIGKRREKERKREIDDNTIVFSIRLYGGTTI